MRDGGSRFGWVGGMEHGRGRGAEMLLMNVREMAVNTGDGGVGGM